MFEHLSERLLDFPVHLRGAARAGRVRKPRDALCLPPVDPATEGVPVALEDVRQLVERIATGKQEDGVGALPLPVAARMTVNTLQGSFVGVGQGGRRFHGASLPHQIPQNF